MFLSLSQFNGEISLCLTVVLFDTSVECGSNREISVWLFVSEGAIIQIRRKPLLGLVRLLLEDKYRVSLERWFGITPHKR